jgi:hypothetical protein
LRRARRAVVSEAAAFMSDATVAWLMFTGSPIAVRSTKQIRAIGRKIFLWEQRYLSTSKLTPDAYPNGIA